jgi:hypothetical protein
MCVALFYLLRGPKGFQKVSLNLAGKNIEGQKYKDSHREIEMAIGN